MASEAQRKRPTVFISYAHESDALRASVKALAGWLNDHGCTVLTDHPYVYRPPREGWQAWMHDCVRKADVVLVVCTPKLKARYEKNEEPGVGFGATFEGANVTQHISHAAMRNTKFFPIMPDGGSYDNVPTMLRPWWNGHSFPSGYEGIRRMIFNEPVVEKSTAAPPATAPSPTSDAQVDRGPLRFQEDFARKLLGTEGALPFFHALQEEILEHFPNELDREGSPTDWGCDLSCMLVREASVHGSCALWRSSAACG